MVTRADIEWVKSSSRSPEKAGWHAVAFCWDAEEGDHAQVDYWDGAKWAKDTGTLPVIAYAGPFESEEIATEWTALRA